MDAKRVVTDALGAGGGERIGALAFWSIDGAKVRRDDLRAALERVGLEGVVPKAPAPATCFREALKAAERLHSGMESVVVAKRGGTVVYALVSKRADPASERVSYTQRGTIRLEDGGAIVSTVDANVPEDERVPTQDNVDAFTRTTADHFSELTTYVDGGELGGILAASIGGTDTRVGLGGVNVRGRTGGVYFVPAASVDRLLALASYVETIGRSSVTVWPIHADARDSSNVAGSVQADIHERIADVVREVEQVVADARASGSVGFMRDDKVARTRLERFERLRQRAELYRDVLASEASDLDRALDVAKSTLESALFGGGR